MKSNECLIQFECHACGNKARQKECKYFEAEKNGWCRYSHEQYDSCKCDEAQKDALDEELKQRVGERRDEIREI